MSSRTISAAGAGVPDPANILCGKFTDTDGSSGTLITIPAGRVWRGTISMNVTGSVAASGSAISSKATIQLSGSGTPTPATGQVLLSVGISISAQGTATTGCATNRDSQVVTLFADASNSLAVTVTKNSVTAFSATAFGELIA